MNSPSSDKLAEDSGAMPLGSVVLGQCFHLTMPASSRPPDLAPESSSALRVDLPKPSFAFRSGHGFTLAPAHS